MAKQLLFEINTRYWMYQLRKQYDEELTLATIPGTELEDIANMGFDWVWLMGVWEHSELDEEFLENHPGLIHEVRDALDDWNDADIIGSPYSVKSYDIHPMLGSHDDYITLKNRFNDLGIKVMVDFVPNHFGFQSDLAITNPDYFINLTEEPPEDQKHLFKELYTRKGMRWIAYGKDPYFPPWDDTFQINIWNPETRSYMIDQLKSVASISDGVRCDMAMLVNNDIFDKSWGWLLEGKWECPDTEFWPVAISSVKDNYPEYTFLGEIYWDMEWEMLQLGFDYAYDKRLYDRMVEDDITGIHAHLQADLTYQAHMCRFIENHDEPRALEAMELDQSLAAAAMIMTLPGMTLVHQGQLTGQELKIPVQLIRKTEENTKQFLERQYWKIIEYTNEIIPDEAIWHSNDINATKELPSDTLFAWTWQTADQVFVVVINYANREADGLVRLNTTHEIFQNQDLVFKDHFQGENYRWRSTDLKQDGLYVKLPAWGVHLFEVIIKD